MMHEWLEEGTAGVCTHSTLHSKLWSREKTSRLLLTQKKSSTQYVGSTGDQSVIFLTLLSRNMQISNVFQD